jgi:hypothetical protein
MSELSHERSLIEMIEGNSRNDEKSLTDAQAYTALVGSADRFMSRGSTEKKAGLLRWSGNGLLEFASNENS